MRKRIGEILNSINVQYTCFAILFGIFFSFAIVTWQVPDEYTHLILIGEEINNDELVPCIDDELNFDGGRILHSVEEKMSLSEMRRLMTTPAHYNREQLFIKGVSIKALRHLPAIVGIQVGALFHLPVYWILQLAEMMSLLFYIFVGNVVLKIVPCNKRIFQLVMLTPMSIHQAASISYDAVLLPLCYFFVAYIVWINSQKRVGWKNFLGVCLLVVVIFVIKIPYVALGLLVLTLPFQGWYFSWKNGKEIRIKGNAIRLLLIACMLLGAGAFLVLFQDSFYVEILFATISNIAQTLKILGATAVVQRDHIITSFVGTFGWLDTFLPKGLPYVFASFLFFLAIKKNNEDRYNLDTKTKAVFLTTGLFTCVIVTVSMISYSVLMKLYGVEDHSLPVDYNQGIYLINLIRGIQGRYYLPAALPLLLAMPKWVYIDEKRYNILLNILLVVMFFGTVLCVIQRYFGLGFLGDRNVVF